VLVGCHKKFFTHRGFDLTTLTPQYHDPAFGDGLAELIGITRAHLHNALRYLLLIPASRNWHPTLLLMGIRHGNFNFTQNQSTAKFYSRRTSKNLSAQRLKPQFGRVI
jgi:hypothetical protein